MVVSKFVKPAKKEAGIIYEQITVVILLLLIIALSLLFAYEFLAQKAALNQQKEDLEALVDYVYANPNDGKSRLALAFTYQKSHDFAKAKNLYYEALKNDPQELSALYNLGIIAKEQGKQEDAEKFFKQVLSLKSNHYLGHIGLGEVYINQGKNDQAIKVLNEVIKIQGYMTEPRLLKAQALEKKSNYAGALQEYQEVLKYVPNQATALSAIKRIQKLGGDKQ